MSELVVVTDNDLVVIDGPRASMSTATPTALLIGAAADRPIVDALLERVAAAETES